MRNESSVSVLSRRPMLHGVVAVFFLCQLQASIVAAAGQESADVEVNTEHSPLNSIPDQGAVLYYQAAVRQRAGDSSEALRLLKECISLQEGFDPSGSPTFKNLLKESPGWSAPIRKLHREFPSVSRARLAFVTRERDLVPEGMAYDSRQAVFYLSSLNRRKIVRIAADGKASDFVREGSEGFLPILGIRMDPTDGSVWANSWSEDAYRSELLHFDFSGRLLGRYAIAGAEKHGFNDLVVRKNGAVLLTDSLSNQVYRFDRQSAAFTPVALHRALAEPNGIALSEDDSQLFVADDFGIQRLDLLRNATSEVYPGARNTPAGVDGLYWHRGSLIGIQNAIGSPRIAVFRLSEDGTKITQTTVLEYRSTFLMGEPTTGAIKGDDFYFIVNSQGEHMSGDRVENPAKLEPVRIGVIRLP